MYQLYIQLVTLLCVVYQVFCSATPAIPKEVVFTCDQSGNINSINSIENIFIDTNDPTKGLCHPNSTSNYTNCFSSKRTKMNVVYMEAKQVHEKIEGGIYKSFTLECTGKSYTANAIAIPFIVSTNVPTANTVLTHKVPDLESPTLEIFTDTGLALPTLGVNIGDKLKLKMTITVSAIYTDISPFSCYAENANQGATEGAVTFWERCDTTNSMTDTAIMSGEWGHSQPISGKKAVEIFFYAFHFKDSSNVKITCAANVCTDNDTNSCKLECKRRRRSIDMKEVPSKSVVVKKSSVSFTVRSDKDIQNSSKGLSSSYLTSSVVLTLWATLKKVF